MQCLFGCFTEKVRIGSRQLTGLLHLVCGIPSGIRVAHSSARSLFVQAVGYDQQFRVVASACLRIAISLLAAEPIRRTPKGRARHLPCLLYTSDAADE